MPSLKAIAAQAHLALRDALRIEEWPQRFGPALEWVSEVIAFAAQRTRDVRVAQVAASLTFTTVLSIVPLLAVALSLFSAFPLFAEFRLALEQMLLRELLPVQISATILRYLNDFTSKAAGLTAFGLLFLVVTALLMILTVDRALNDIFRVRQRRRVMPRILVYWALLTLGPLVLGAGLSATSYVFSEATGAGPGLPKWLTVILDFTLYVFGAFVLAGLYVVVPYRKVYWRDALVGGFVGSSLSEVVTEGFTAYIKTGTLAGIYGAFSVLPLFLLWVYLSWFVVLFGASVAATLPMLRGTRFADERRAGNRFVTAVALLRALHAARASALDDGRVPLERLARNVRIFVEDAEQLLDELERLGYVCRLAGEHDGKWLLTCDPAQTDLRAAFARFAVDPHISLVTREERSLGAWMQRGMDADWISQPLQKTFEPAGRTPP